MGDEYSVDAIKRYAGNLYRSGVDFFNGLFSPELGQQRTGALKADARKKDEFKHLVAGLSTGNYPNINTYSPGNSIHTDAHTRTT